jgi:oxygen-independent coproporphyrinogen-3 oxidase
MIPLSLYIHIPWCERKCPYCDFNSHVAKQDISDPELQDTYVQCLLADLQNDLIRFNEALGSRAISSIFIGGGTPSLFSSRAIKDLLEGIKKLVAFDSDIEITLESNPGSSEASKFAGFLEAGVNRLSIGIQSFNNDALQRLGRIHNSEQAISAAQAAKQAGFKRLNLDLMFGLPEQTIEQSIVDIEQALELKPDHISAYELTLEPNTLFHHQPPKLPKDEAKWEMYEAIQTRLAADNFKQYEVSAYAKPDQQCRHNRNYWQFGDYLGIGAGAHSKLTNPTFEVSRSWKVKHPSTYISAMSTNESISKGVGETKTVSQKDLAFEFMLNAMRLTGGFDLSLFKQRTGLAIEQIEPTIAKHQQLGLLALTKGHLTSTAKGKQFIDSMLQDYL